MVMLLTLLSLGVCAEIAALNERPVIGIPAGVLKLDDQKLKATDTFIAASFVKFVESAGAQVVPVMYNQSDSYYEMIFNNTNGLLLPGEGTEYRTTAFKLLDIVLKNPEDHYPVWGIGMGFENIMLYFNNKAKDTLRECFELNLRKNLDFTSDAVSSRMFTDPYFSKDILSILSKENVNVHFHMHCVMKETFYNSPLKDHFYAVSTNRDMIGEEYISIVEGKTLPIYGVIFCPQMSSFEWAPLSPISHSLEAVLVSQYFANFFVQEARKNNHRMSYADLTKMAIYNFPPTFTGTYTVNTQRYIFPQNDFVHSAEVQFK